jgi:FMN-dependent NADH-azoreductase
MSENEKIDRLRELMDFFILEDHMVIYDDLWSIMNMVLLKKYMECSASDLI